LHDCLRFLLLLFVLGLGVVTAGCEKVESIFGQLWSLRGINTESDRVWIRKELDNDKLIIFIHGFNSTNETAWGQFPSLLQGDDNFKDFSIVLYGYPTRVCTSVENIHEEGNRLASFLNDIFNTTSPKYRRIILVGHSMGGLVGMHALLILERDHFVVLNEQDLRVVSFGTPYIGVENTDLLPPLCKNKQTEDMAVLNNGLHELSRAWTQRFNQELNTVARLTPQVPFYTFWGIRDRFVTRQSACGYAKVPCEAVDGDHYSIVKPVTREHLAYNKLRLISLEHRQNTATAQRQSEKELVIQGVMPVHLREDVRFGDARFVDRRLGFIVKTLNNATIPKTVEFFIIDGCTPIDPLVPREMFIDRDLLREPITFDDSFAALGRTAVHKIRVSGSVRADSRVIPAGGVGYVGVLLPLPPGRSGAMMVVENSASLKGECSKIPKATTQPSIAQLLRIGPVHNSEPKDVAQSFRNGSLRMTLQVSSKAVTIRPSLVGKLHTLTWNTWRSLDLARMYEVPETDYPPMLDPER
jgi:surfactin synthase thioesterase subunit